MKDVVLFVRVSDMMRTCEQLSGEGHPESPRLSAAAEAFKQILGEIERRLKDGKGPEEID